MRRFARDRGGWCLCRLSSIRSDQRRACGRHRRFDQALEIVLVRRPARVVSPLATAMATMSATVAPASAARRDLVDAIVPITTMVRFFGASVAIVEREPSCINTRAVAFERKYAAVRLRQRHTKRDREREAHAAEHVKILRPVAGAHKSKLCLPMRRSRLPRFSIRDQPRGKIEAVHDLVLAGRGGCS